MYIYRSTCSMRRMQWYLILLNSTTRSPLLSTPPFFNPSIDRMESKSKDSATARVPDLPLSGIILFHTSVVFPNILTCFLIVDKEHTIREKPLSLTESKRELQTDEGYTLTKLSQDEILVEFSDQSTANPPNWTAVRTEPLYSFKSCQN